MLRSPSGVAIELRRDGEDRGGGVRDGRTGADDVDEEGEAGGED